MTSGPDPHLKFFNKDIEGGSLSIVLYTKKQRYESGRGYSVSIFFCPDEGESRTLKQVVCPKLKEARSVYERWKKEKGCCLRAFDEVSN